MPPALRGLIVTVTIAGGFSGSMFARADSSASNRKVKLETATFAVGCFWGTEEFFRKLPGVVETRVGYTGGTLANPKYEDTHDSLSGHAESVEIQFDPSRITYAQLLDSFFKMHDPTTLNRQLNDRGS